MTLSGMAIPDNSAQDGGARFRKRPRSLGRRLVMQYLFAVDLGSGFGSETIDYFLDLQREAEQEAGVDLDNGEAARDWAAATVFARELAAAILSRRDELDVRIAGAATNWDVRRVAAVERNILRLAAWELLAGAVDRAVVIDEAVRLAKLFGGKDSGAFVNGVLDAMGKP